MSEANEEKEKLKQDDEQNTKILSHLALLAEGKIPANTAKRQRFLEVVKGALPPVTDWEHIFVNWKKLGNISPALYFHSGQAQKEFRTSKSQTKGLKKGEVNLEISPRKKVKSKKGQRANREQMLKQRKIEETHRKSGYYKKKVKIVSGGGFSPR